MHDIDIQPELTIHIGESSIELTETGLVLSDDMPYEEWQRGLSLWKYMQTRMKAGFAEYLKFGEVKFGKERVHASLTQFEFDLGFVTTAMQINSVPEALRHPELTAEHYVVLARAKSLTPTQQAKWSKVASDQKLTPTQLKVSIEQGEVVDTHTARKQTHGIVGIPGIAMEFDIWLDRMEGKEGIAKMDEATRREIAGYLAKFAELHEFIMEGLS